MERTTHHYKHYTLQEDEIIRQAVEQATRKGTPHLWRPLAIAKLPHRRPDSLSARKGRLFAEEQAARSSGLSSWRIELENGRRFVTTAQSAGEAMSMLNPTLGKLVTHIIRQ